MAQIKILLLVFLSLWVSNTRILHGQTTAEQQNFDYYQSLVAKENELKVSLANVKSSIEYLHSTL